MASDPNVRTVNVDFTDWKIAKISDMDYRVSGAAGVVGDFMVAPNEDGQPTAWVSGPNIDQTMRVAKAALQQKVVPF
jgi:hypothetical protein